MPADRDAHVEFSGRPDAPYWNALGEGVLRIQQCDVCHEWTWPAEWRCYVCGSYQLTWQHVEASGDVFSWIRTHYAFVPSYADLIPYVNVLVALPQAGSVRLMGLLVGDETGIHVGKRVTGVFEAASARTSDLPVLRWRLEGGS